MREGIILLGIIIAIIAVVIYIVKNNTFFLETFNKIKKKKIKYIFIFFIIICLAYFLYANIQNISENIRIYNKGKKFDKGFEYSDNKKAEENTFYKEIYNKKYEKNNYTNPYIPEGFVYVEGTYTDGFVIQDKNDNQYVWVPCTNENIEGIPKLKKKNFTIPALISKDFCYDEKYEEFLKSALENGGFYISRFEIGKENNKPVSKSNVEVYTNLTKKEAKQIISIMNEDIDINCEMINGFAYDTVLEWIKMNQNIEKQIVDIQKEEIIYTGRKSHNRIYDLFDNMLEFSTEFFYDTLVVRGVAVSDKEVDLGTNFSEESRYTTFDDSIYVNLQDRLSIRTILYK